MKTYYIVYETEIQKGWKITKTEFDLDTPWGLGEYILQLGNKVIVLYWKELKPKKFWQFWR